MNLSATEIKAIVSEFLNSFGVNNLYLQDDQGKNAFSNEETREAITRRLTPLLSALCDNKVHSIKDRFFTAIDKKMCSITLEKLATAEDELLKKRDALTNEYSGYATLAKTLNLTCV